MDTRLEMFVYSVLIISAACLSFLLVTSVFNAQAERESLHESAPEYINIEDVAIPEPIRIATAICVFERDLFGPINPRIPTPTQVILPTPTPTVPPLLAGWTILHIMGGRLCQICEPNGTKHIVKAGDSTRRTARMHHMKSGKL